MGHIAFCLATGYAELSDFVQIIYGKIKFV